MAENGYDTLNVVGRYVPEPMLNAQGNPASPQELGHDVIDPVTGMYEIGCLLDGAFIPLISEKASLVYDRVNLHKQQQAEAQKQAQEQQAAEQQQAAQQQQASPPPLPAQTTEGTSPMQTGETQPETGPQSGQAQAPPSQSQA